jgi:hypothetical protein
LARSVRVLHASEGSYLVFTSGVLLNVAVVRASVSTAAG